MKYPREKKLGPRNAQDKKLWTHEILTRKNLRPTKYLEKLATYETPTRKNCETTTAQWHGDMRPTRQMMAQNLWNLPHLLLNNSVFRDRKYNTI